MTEHRLSAPSEVKTQTMKLAIVLGTRPESSNSRRLSEK